MRFSWRVIFLVGAVGVSAFPIDQLGETVILNEDIEVSHAERMNYPLSGRVHVVEGAVVVKLDIQKDGSVHKATAISGPRQLIDECVKNSTKWRFNRAGRGTALVVYLFQIRGLCELPCPSNFEFYPPNVVIVSMGSPLATP
jgi:hypothetical protein